MLAHPQARTKRPRSPSPNSSPSNASPLDELIKRRRSGYEPRPAFERSASGEEEWAGVERRRHRMWERAQEPPVAGPSRLPTTAAAPIESPVDVGQQLQQANHWATPVPSRAYHSHHHHHQRGHQVSSSPIKQLEDAPTYSPFGFGEVGSSTGAGAGTGTVAYREPSGYFDLRTPGSPLASPTPVPGPWDSPYAGSNALLHQLHLARLAGPQATPISLSPLVLSPQPQHTNDNDDMDMDYDHEHDEDEGLSGYESTNRMLGELDQIRQQRWAGGR